MRALQHCSAARPLCARLAPPTCVRWSCAAAHGGAACALCVPRLSPRLCIVCGIRLTHRWCARSAAYGGGGRLGGCGGAVQESEPTVLQGRLYACCRDPWQGSRCGAGFGPHRLSHHHCAATFRGQRLAGARSFAGRAPCGCKGSHGTCCWLHCQRCSAAKLPARCSQALAARLRTPGTCWCCGIAQSA